MDDAGAGEREGEGGTEGRREGWREIGREGDNAQQRESLRCGSAVHETMVTRDAEGQERRDKNSQDKGDRFSFLRVM